MKTLVQFIRTIDDIYESRHGPFKLLIAAILLALALIPLFIIFGKSRFALPAV